MPAFVALFRAVNVGGRGTVAMADLREMAAGLGLLGPRTVVQSGNLVFVADLTDSETLHSRLEAASKTEFGLETRVLVRSAPQWAEVVAACPFPDLSRTDPSHLLVMPLRDVPAPDAEVALRAAISGREAVAVRGATAYLAYPDGIGRSKLTAAMVERRLGTFGTGRNWNTVLKIAAALAA